MGYYIDLSKIDLDQYLTKLKSADLLPSRMVLKEEIENNFESIKGQGIFTVETLLRSIDTKKKVQGFSKQSHIDENYLTILARELKSYRQPPNKIRDFPELSPEVTKKLEEAGIKNTQQLYDKILTFEDRAKLSKELAVHGNDVLKLAKLTDLSRIRWVNHTFAHVLMEAGYDTAKKVANANYEKLYETVRQLNEERKIYRAHIGLHDMKLCVEAARELSLEIEY
ncbi:DUF4332 domain-containing protein [Allomuricauda sp. SCSIO 65647]|uniref:DUF4332 domain-containing protein n=1 Tax=Allomuricauda sp. SCSIO 65647 TaxID=2908843 RepID=UPI001F3808B8|nr:DUF4332 domain-containing protein [Muricauda sp. SCSIO 65647]UJH67546.1 DUF4332 domain-containing protein [Muricauda sp. SCSIO 65647]